MHSSRLFAGPQQTFQEIIGNGTYMNIMRSLYFRLFKPLH